MLKHPDNSSPSGLRYELTQEEHDEGKVAFITGPVSGTIVLPSGAAYELDDYAIAVDKEHVGELHVAIHKAHHAAGKFLDTPVPDVADVSLTE